MCDDCQAYAHYLGRAGAILDAWGGTDLSYATPNRVIIDEGKDLLACVRLSESGLLRWYTRCCMTPIANTAPSHRTAFVGIVHVAMHSRRNAAQRDMDVGPVRYRLQARFASAQPPRDAHLGEPWLLLARGYVRILWDSLRGLHTPNPFFDVATGRPIALPTVISKKASR